LHSSAPHTTNTSSSPLKFKAVAFLLIALLVFLFSISFMVASLRHLGDTFTDTLLLATANPFTGLFIGLLVTAIFQSSSTTTSLIVALVASGSITIDAAIPIIIGANIGTTITSTVVSLAFINRKKEYKRALAAGTYHDFFNILNAVIFMILESIYGVLSKSASAVTSFVFPFVKPVGKVTTPVGFGLSSIVDTCLELVHYPIILAMIALAFMFASVLVFRRITANILQVQRPEVFQRFFFQNGLKSLIWGVVTTAAIRSSTVTTSVVVPLVAKKIINLRKAAPFILGANIGTTITAFIAVTINANTPEAMTIAMVHFLFNFFGVLIFLFVPMVKEIPFQLANRLGRLTYRFRFAGLVYLLSTFFLIPFTLIFLTRNHDEGGAKKTTSGVPVKEVVIDQPEEEKPSGAERK
jgi:solute carrier family 34 (sodium-dependent phosphate cotransporter)